MPNPTRLVINTGPLLALIAAWGDLRLLSQLYHHVIVPAEVRLELEAGGATGFGVREFQAATWLNQRSNPVVLSPLLSRGLDRGEASVIQTALNEHVELVAIDEPVGRRLARLHGLTLTGSIGILLRAKREQHLSSVKDAILRMQAHGIWISQRVVEYALIQSGEK